MTIKQLMRQQVQLWALTELERSEVFPLWQGYSLPFHTALSKACQKRALKESQCEGDDKKFLGWRREHLATGECDINFNGSSSALEAEWAFLLWRRSIELQKKKNITSGWCLTETGKLSKLLKICTCWIESYYIGLYWPCPKENMDAPFELKSKDKGKLKYGKPIGGAEGSLIQK